MNGRQERKIPGLPPIAPPTDFFSGVRLGTALTPDNLLFFKRTDNAAFRPGGVIDNFHSRFELVTVFRKGGPVRIDETTFLLEPGDSVLLFPNQFHHYLDVEPGPMEWLFITFELGEADAIEPLRNAPRRVGPEGLLALRELVQAYRCLTPGGPEAVAISSRLAQFLCALRQAPLLPAARRNLNAANADRDALLKKINRYVRDHLRDNPGIASLAEALGYSVSHLRAIFRSELGLSLGKYWRQSRLAHASQLLQEGGHSIAQIAEKTGFDSAFAFSRAFKRAYQLSPREYGRRIRKS